MWWRVVLAFLAYIVLGAHFLRDGNLLAAAGAVLLPILLLLKERRLTQALQLGLVLGAIFIWVPTTWEIAQQRLAQEQPYLRMIAIMGTMFCFNLLVAWLIRPMKTCQFAHKTL